MMLSFSSILEQDELIDMVGGAPLIVKLLEGTQGKGVVLASKVLKSGKKRQEVKNDLLSNIAPLIIQSCSRNFLF